jgi:hypothetical protein
MVLGGGDSPAGIIECSIKEDVNGRVMGSDHWFVNAAEELVALEGPPPLFK